MWMRGGTSKGGYFLASDLPASVTERDKVLLGIMGSPDPRQIDGMGGADPLTSKIAIVRKSEKAGVDVDYLFLQIMVDQAVVSDAQNCGNILAGIGPFAIERGLVEVNDDITNVTIYMENTGQIAEVEVQTPNGLVTYEGVAQIDGVPGKAAPVLIDFKDTAGSSCGALLPTGNTLDTIDNIELTMIDNGMPVVILRASDMGITGLETPEELDADKTLRTRLESIRLQAGPLMNLGDVANKTTPKMTMIAPANQGGAISTRTFIPHRCHKAIGVLGAVSVATACLIKGSSAYELSARGHGFTRALAIEHPSGEMTVMAKIDDQNTVTSAAILRTARKLMDGVVYA